MFSLTHSESFQSVKFVLVSKLTVSVKKEPEKMEEKEDLSSEKNCGVTDDCGAASFSVRLYTGLENKVFPKICVNGK